MSSINGSRVRFPEAVFRILKTGAASIVASFDLTNLTASRAITLPDKAGTLAMTSDVSAAADVADNVFRISDNGDSTKKIAFEASGIDASTVRTITAPNRNHTLGGVELWATATKYIIGDVVGISYLGSVRFYRCTTAHTAAAAFTTDVATKWTFLGAMQFEAALFAIMQTADPTKTASFDLSLLSASRSITLPDKAGTLAMTSDITAGSLSDTQFLYRQALRNPAYDFWYAGTQTAPATGTELAYLYFAIKTAGGGTAPSITFSQDNSTLPSKKSAYVLKANVTAVGTASTTTEAGYYHDVADFAKFQGESISFSIQMKAPANSEIVDIVIDDGVQTTLISRKTLTTSWAIYKYENVSINSAATKLRIILRMAGGTALSIASSANFVPANTGAFYFGEGQLNDGTSVIGFQPLPSNINVETNWRSNLTFTPASAAFGTIANTSYWWRRVGDSMEVRGNFTAGTVAGSTASIALPTGYTIDSSKLPNTAISKLGEFFNEKSANTGIMGAGTIHFLFYDGSDTAKLYIADATASFAFVKVNGNTICGNSEVGFFNFIVPITQWAL